MTSRFTRLHVAALSLGLGYGLMASAADETPDESEIATVTVTGSLIPQRTDIETAAPITVITATDLQVRGFTSIAQALQQTAFANGSVQNAQFSGGFTPGAKTLSLFGLSPSYVKYLIDGRPMIDYPALYNGTDVITSISGIPMELVERIDVLPGGQSSIYGSDAIAGVVNIILKKKLDGSSINVRYQSYQDGGGRDRHVTAATGMSFGSVNLVAGAEFGKIDPIWGYQRNFTDSYFTKGTSPQVAERDFLVLGNGIVQAAPAYSFQDPNNCANVSGLFNGSVARQTRPNRGDYCGTRSAGFYTLNNSARQLNGYLHATMDVNPGLQLYSDFLASNEKVGWNGGTRYYSTDIDFGLVYEPVIDEFVTLQHIFGPEEEGGLHNHMDKANTKSYRATLGGTGAVGASSWTYDAGFTFAQQKLTEHTDLLLTDQVENFFAPIINITGVDPYFGFYPQVEPDYAAFYSPLTPADFDSFNADTTSKSKTTDTLFRVQLTNPALFSMPAGDAGLAVVGEWGRQKWNYNPDERFFNGQAYAYTATAGGGKRSRYAFTSELRVPLLSMLTFTGSGRYDAYRVSGSTVDKATYMAGLELRPVKQLLVRGRYGTAFKAPTLSDEFQGQSGFYQLVPDYYQCALSGFDFGHATDCLYYDYYFGNTAGNPALKPINAKVWDVGVVFAPLPKLSITADLLHWNIDDEVTQQDSDQLLRDEASCRLGLLDPSSGQCQAALSLVTRDANGFIESFLTPKINVSNEKITALSLSLAYEQEIGRFGSLGFQASWNNMMNHKYRQFDNTAVLNLLTNPYWSTEFRNSGNASVTWNIARASTTLYMNARGKAPNYLATLTPDGYLTDGARKLKSWTTYNLNFGYDVTDNISLSATVDNLFDKMPPFDGSYPGTEFQPYNIFNYDVYGRSYLLEMAYKFGK